MPSPEMHASMTACPLLHRKRPFGRWITSCPSTLKCHVLAEPAMHSCPASASTLAGRPAEARSEEHTSELQSLMRISYAVFCLKKKKSKSQDLHHRQTV